MKLAPSTLATLDALREKCRPTVDRTDAAQEV